MSKHLPGGNDSPRVERHLIKRGSKFDFEEVTLTGTDGKPITREVVRHPGAVAIVPILETAAGRQVVFIKNWRVSIEQWLLEIPAGTLEKGEEPAACAARELIEETGFEAATITPLCRFYTSPGFSDEMMWAYAAHGLRSVGQDLEVDERVTVHPTPVDRALAMIASGELTDGKSIAALMVAKDRQML